MGLSGEFLEFIEVSRCKDFDCFGYISFGNDFVLSLIRDVIVPFLRESWAVSRACCFCLICRLAAEDA